MKVCIYHQTIYTRTIEVDGVLVVIAVRVVIVACAETAVDVEDDVLDGENARWAVRYLRGYPCLVPHYSIVASALVFSLFALSYARVVENKCNSSLALQFGMNAHELT